MIPYLGAEDVFALLPSADAVTAIESARSSTGRR